MTLFRLGMLVVVAASIAACGDNTAEQYPNAANTSQTDTQLSEFYEDNAETTKRGFLENCDSAGNRPFCDCFVAAIEDEMTYAEYLTDMSGANGTEAEERITEKNDAWTLACMTAQ